MSAAATVAELEGLLRGTRITALTLSTPAETITLHRDPGRRDSGRREAASDQAGPAAAPVTEPRMLVVPAPCSGVFLHRHPLHEEPLVQVGQPVQAGTVLGLLRVGPLLLHVAAPCAGTVAAIAVAEDAVVGYGTPLLHLVGNEGA